MMIIISDMNLVNLTTSLWWWFSQVEVSVFRTCHYIHE